MGRADFFKFLNALGFRLVPMANRGIFSLPLMFAPINTIIHVFDCFYPRCCSPMKPRLFSGNIYQNKPVSSPLNTFSGSYLARIYFMTTSRHYVTTPWSTPPASPTFDIFLTFHLSIQALLGALSCLNSFANPATFCTKLRHQY